MTGYPLIHANEFNLNLCDNCGMERDVLVRLGKPSDLYGTQGGDFCQVCIEAASRTLARHYDAVYKAHPLYKHTYGYKVEELGDAWKNLIQKIKDAIRNG